MSLKITASRNVVGRLLLQARKEVGLRQVQLAEILGHPQSFVSKYETGERRLELVEIHEICEALGLKLEEFVRKYLESNS